MHQTFCLVFAYLSVKLFLSFDNIVVVGLLCSWLTDLTFSWGLLWSGRNFSTQMLYCLDRGSFILLLCCLWNVILYQWQGWKCSPDCSPVLSNRQNIFSPVSVSIYTVTKGKKSIFLLLDNNQTIICFNHHCYSSLQHLGLLAWPKKSGQMTFTVSIMSCLRVVILTTKIMALLLSSLITTVVDLSVTVVFKTSQMGVENQWQFYPNK